MANINIERKNAVWPWILAAIIVLVLIWLLIKAFDVDPAATTGRTAAATSATTAETATLGNDADMGTSPATNAITAAGTNPEGYAGTYSNGGTQLTLDADGTYSMQESPAGEGRGTWTHEANANALHLTPEDGSPQRHFRIQGTDTLLALSTDGASAGQVAPLTRQERQ